MNEFVAIECYGHNYLALRTNIGYGLNEAIHIF